MEDCILCSKPPKLVIKEDADSGGYIVSFKYTCSDYSCHQHTNWYRLRTQAVTEWNQINRGIL